MTDITPDIIEQARRVLVDEGADSEVSTGAVRGRYCDGTYLQTGHHTEGLEFDQWLAAHDAEVAAKALESAATSYQMRGWASAPQAEIDLAAKRRAAEHAVAWLRNRAHLIEQGGQP